MGGGREKVGRVGQGGDRGGTGEMGVWGGHFFGVALAQHVVQSDEEVVAAAAGETKHAKQAAHVT